MEDFWKVNTFCFAVEISNPSESVFFSLTCDHSISVHRGTFSKRDVLGSVVQQQEPAGEPEPHLLREPAVGSPAATSGQSSQPVLSRSRGAEGRGVRLLWSLRCCLRGQEIIWTEKRHCVRKRDSV